MNNDEDRSKIENFIKSLDPKTKPIYQQIAGYNLGRIRNQHFPNKLSAMAAMLQENNFRETLNPRDLERQLRRWIRNGLPLENIEPIAMALKMSFSELLDTSTMPPFVNSSSENNNPPVSFHDVSSTNPENAINGFPLRAFGKRRKIVNRIVIPGVFLLVLIITIHGIIAFLSKEKIIISWPTIVDTHSEYVSGRLLNFSERNYSDTSIKLFVKPGDGDTKYWLNTPDYPPRLTKGGVWYQKCRFGDEDIRSMKKAPPLRFDLYAAVLKKDVAFPLNLKKSFLDAKNENDFLKMLEPYVVAVSDKFSLVRVKPAGSDIPIVLGIAPPVKITWGENVPMYLEIYHGGQVIKDGYYSSGDAHDLIPSQIPYEIKMSRKQGHHQTNTWILVENR